VTGSGEPASWAEVATATFALAGYGDLRVTPTSTADYFADRPEAARRPLHSVLDLTKATEAGVPLADWRGRLADYVSAARS
jgi:dTDP-4-dehydrorhamnose reductase